MKIGFLGLGVMGLPMAKNVVKKCGCPVLGYDVAEGQEPVACSERPGGQTVCFYDRRAAVRRPLVSVRA